MERVAAILNFEDAHEHTVGQEEEDAPKYYGKLLLLAISDSRNPQGQRDRRKRKSTI